MINNPYDRFWVELQTLIIQSRTSKFELAKLIEAELDPISNGTYRKLCWWMARETPLDAVCFLIAILESLGYELVIRKK
jgi:hypothetical protein